MLVVDALATKYDCHNEEANLVDTLKNILKKNEERQAASTTTCEADRAQATQEQSESKARALALFNNNTAKFAETLAKKKSATAAELLHVQTSQQSKVDAATAAATAATQHLNANKSAYEAQKTQWAVANRTHAESLAEAKAILAATLSDNADTKAESLKAAADAHDAAVDAASKAHATKKAACAQAFNATKASLNMEHETIASVEALVNKLKLCEQGTATATTGSSQGLRARVVDEQPAATVLLETSATACMRMREQLRSLAPPAVPAGQVTGDVDDFKARLQALRGKNQATKTQCLTAGENAYQAAVTRANNAQAAANDAADRVFDQANKDAEGAYNEEQAKLDGAKRAAKAEHDKAEDAHAVAAEARKAAADELEAAEAGQQEAVKEATEAKAAKDRTAQSNHDDRVNKAQKAKDEAYATADQTELEKRGDIDKRCAEEKDELEAEKLTVQKIQVSLKDLKLVHADVTTATPTGETTTAAPKAPSSTTAAPRICCKAMTASCLSCAAGMTVDEYCATPQGRGVSGCPALTTSGMGSRG